MDTRQKIIKIFMEQRGRAITTLHEMKPETNGFILIGITKMRGGDDENSQLVLGAEAISTIHLQPDELWVAIIASLMKQDKTFRKIFTDAVKQYENFEAMQMLTDATRDV
jgi:hypothetical protein